MIVFHIHDEGARPPPRRAVGPGWNAIAVRLDRLDPAAVTMRHCVFDLDLKNLEKVRSVRAFLGSAQRPSTRIFVRSHGDHHDEIQSSALGATAAADRPLRDPQLSTLLGRGEADPEPCSTVTGAVALDTVFKALVAGAAFDASSLPDVTSDIAADIADTGVAPWLQSIYRHHRGTYQHCLVVTGLATAFGQEIGLRRADLADLSNAALLHDIGKARINPSILDKPSRLDPAELATMRLHPVWGEEYLRKHATVPPAIRAAVRHHHEYLDGSGYPDGLAGRAISDLTRLLTIADIAGALLERRAYKPPMPAAAVLATLRDLAGRGKIERPLVEAFAAVLTGLPDPPAEARASA